MVLDTGTPDDGDDETREAQDRDLLKEFSREIAFGLVLLAGVLFVLSIGATETSQLPEIAFGWKLGLDILRAAIVFGALAALIMVLVRGFGGMWPSKLSTSGLDYDQIRRTASDLRKDLDELDRLERAARTTREERTYERSALSVP